MINFKLLAQGLRTIADAFDNETTEDKKKKVVKVVKKSKPEAKESKPETPTTEVKEEKPSETPKVDSKVEKQKKHLDAVIMKLHKYKDEVKAVFEKYGAENLDGIDPNDFKKFKCDLDSIKAQAEKAEKAKEEAAKEVVKDDTPKEEKSKPVEAVAPTQDDLKKRMKDILLEHGKAPLIAALKKFKAKDLYSIKEEEYKAFENELIAAVHEKVKGE